MKTVIVDDGDVIVLQRRFDGKEQVRIEITDKLIPRGEQILRTYAVIFSEQWRVLGSDADSGNNTVFIRLCTQD